MTSMIAGTPALAAPINCAGTVLSQPPIRTTASIGWARIISSVSIAIRLRRYMLVGCEKLSWIEIVGKRIGNAARQHHAALDRLDQLGHVAVAGVVAASVFDDADDRPARARRRCSRALDERLAQEQRESRVAVMGQVPAQSCRVGHRVPFSADKHVGEEMVNLAD